jgi:preprotein translocase subunit SecD
MLDKVGLRSNAGDTVTRPTLPSVLAIGLIGMLLACQASPEPSIAVRTMTVTLPIPVADKAVTDAAGHVFAKRLKALGITDFTVSTGDSMRFTMRVPIAIDDNAVDAVLHRAGLFQLVPWPDGQEGPAPGDPVPAGLQPLFDDPAQFQSATLTTDSAGQGAVEFKLGSIGREAVATYTTAHIGSTLPLVLDGFVLTAPIIQGPITGGVLRLTGPDSPEIPWAAIAAMLASGPLPAAWR